MLLPRMCKWNQVVQQCSNTLKQGGYIRAGHLQAHEQWQHLSAMLLASYNSCVSYNSLMVACIGSKHLHTCSWSQIYFCEIRRSCSPLFAKYLNIYLGGGGIILFCLFVCAYVYLSFFVSVCLSVCLFLGPSVQVLYSRHSWDQPGCHWKGHWLHQRCNGEA